MVNTCGDMVDVKLWLFPLCFENRCEIHTLCALVTYTGMNNIFSHHVITYNKQIINKIYLYWGIGFGLGPVI